MGRPLKKKSPLYHIAALNKVAREISTDERASVKMRASVTRHLADISKLLNDWHLEMLQQKHRKEIEQKHDGD